MATLGSRAVEKRAVLRNEVVSATERNSKHTSNAVYGTDSLRSTFYVRSEKSDIYCSVVRSDQTQCWRHRWRWYIVQRV